MVRLTIAELIDLPDYEIHDRLDGKECVYIFRDEDAVFYIGKSNNPLRRLWQHLAPEILGSWDAGWSKATDIGRFVAANLPEARGWYVDLLTLKDCEQYTVFCLQSLCVDDAEANLIHLLQPSLNREFNGYRCNGQLAKYSCPWAEKISEELWPFQ